MSKKEYKTYVRKELGCGDIVVGRRVARKARWNVQIYRKRNLRVDEIAGFEIISETSNLVEIRSFLRDLVRNTPPSYR